MSFLDRVELNPKVCNGKPVIKGTRIPVSVILDQIAAGDSWDTIIKGYPELSREDIQASLLYASAVLDHTEVMEVHASKAQALSRSVPAVGGCRGSSKRGV
jgi:uncharacterized protein (DUF433 family)